MHNLLGDTFFVVMTAMGMTRDDVRNARTLIIVRILVLILATVAVNAASLLTRLSSLHDRAGPDT